MDKGNQYYWYRFSKIYGTDIRDTYMLVFGSDFSTGYFGMQIFAEMFCNCDVKKISCTPPKEIKDLSIFCNENRTYNFYLYGIKSKYKVSPNLTFHDLVFARSRTSADQIILWKYANGDKKNIDYMYVQSYKYEELYKISDKFRNYEFIYQLKYPNNNRSNIHHLIVMAESSWEAQCKMLVMFAEGDRNKFRTLCTPNEIGYALPTVLRLQKEAEEKQQKENDRLAEKEKWDAWKQEKEKAKLAEKEKREAKKQTNQKVVNTEYNHESIKSIKRRKLKLTFLCILPHTGLFGVHRFLSKKPKSGLFMLFTAGGFLILWITDIFRLISGKFKDTDGIPFKDKLSKK